MIKIFVSRSKDTSEKTIQNEKNIVGITTFFKRYG